MSDNEQNNVTGSVRISQRPKCRDLQLIGHYADDPFKPDRLLATVHFLKDERTTEHNARLLATSQAMRRIIRAAIVCGCLPQTLKHEAEAVLAFQRQSDLTDRN